MRWFAFGVVIALAGCSDAKRDPGQWPISRQELEQSAVRRDPAELTYRRYCIGCHGSDGRGNGGLTGADFTAENSPLSNKSDSELLASVRDGKRGATATMPPHKPVLKDEEIAAVVSYVRQHFGKTTSAAAIP
ncbi:MAG TPA: cytochrome c [Polyangiaceae bacterium]|nr:cytochrome c [Polyangiaceae bacterium]